MNIGIVYSSVTGNTKKLALGIHKILGDAEIMSIEEADDLKRFDLLIIGYWVNRGTADMKTQKLIERLTGKKIAVFGTSGLYGDSDGALRYKDRVKELVQRDNTYLGGFICQGKIEESRTEKRRQIPKGQSHYLDEEGYKRHLESRKHPDEQDLLNVEGWIKSILEELGVMA